MCAFSWTKWSYTCVQTKTNISNVAARYYHYVNKIHIQQQMFPKTNTWMCESTISLSLINIIITTARYYQQLWFRSASYHQNLLPPRSEAVLISSASVSVSVCLFVCRCSNVWMVPFQFTKLSANLHLSNMRFAIEFHGHRCICFFFFFFFFSILFHLNFQALLSKLNLIL